LAAHDELAHFVATCGAQPFFQDLALALADHGVEESRQMHVLVGLDLGGGGEMGHAVAERKTPGQLALEHSQDAFFLRSG